MLVRKLELRFCMARTANALAIFHDGHHRDPGALARWSVVMSSRVVLKSSGIQQQMGFHHLRTEGELWSRLVWKSNVVG